MPASRRPAGARSDWPGASRRWPGLGEAGYLALRPLAEDLAEIAGRQADHSVRVLDIGCQVKPYFPLFERAASEYVGMDLEPGPYVDVVGRAEEIPLGDDEFDIVLLTQVLEHVAEPDRVLREIHRVLRPGGLALVSTHGTFIYHPVPTDYWRWTQEGLRKIFEDNGAWRGIELRPAGGSVATFGYICAWYLKAVLNRVRLGLLARVAIAAVNLSFGAIDRVMVIGHYPRKWTLISNFLVVAEAADEG